MASTMDDIIAEASKQYSKMSLLELLTYENAMNKLIHSGRSVPENALKKLYESLCSEIEKKLQ